VVPCALDEMTGHLVAGDGETDTRRYL
jgi:hypothetical protein